MNYTGYPETISAVLTALTDDYQTAAVIAKKAGKGIPTVSRELSRAVDRGEVQSCYFGPRQRAMYRKPQ